MRSGAVHGVVAQRGDVCDVGALDGPYLVEQMGQHRIADARMKALGLSHCGVPVAQPSGEGLLGPDGTGIHARQCVHLDRTL